jgi:hypothetical protein
MFDPIAFFSLVKQIAIESVYATRTACGYLENSMKMSILLFAALFHVAICATATEASRPNILFALADDMGRHAGIYATMDGPGTANDLIRTPHMDRVGTEGVAFRRAFVSAPSCTPCRSALLSGQHFWRTGRGATTFSYFLGVPLNTGSVTSPPLALVCQTSWYCPGTGTGGTGNGPNS